MRATAVLLGLAAAATAAGAQVGCPPPETPFAYAPPADDPELRALIDEEYQVYIRDTEAYLNCLNAEGARVRAEFQQILDRYLQFFGEEAGVEFDTPG